jgi:CDP-4-dehydro-6-deoxyglucose reductase
MSHYQCRVKDVVQLSEQVFRIRLIPLDLSLLDFKAGQYILLCLPNESKESESMKIPLSIASAPEEKQFLELHIRITHVDSLAEKMIQHFKQSKSIKIEGAFGDCYLLDEKKDIVLIAGGTGFTPMKSIIESCIACQSQRNVSLYLGVQHEGELYQNSLIEQWQSEQPFFSYIPVVSGESQLWQGEVGFPHNVAIKQLGSSITNKDFYIGGSEAMVMAVYYDLLNAGVSKKSIHSDMLDIKRANGQLD